MSPTSLGANPLATPSIPGPPHVPEYWQNPHPDNWKLLDDRKHYLQAQSHNRFLEMHPNATRGVQNYTKYCVLNILILNLTTKALSGIDFLASPDKRVSQGKTWSTNTTALHIIQSNFTGRYLCMDDRGVVYQSANLTQQHCVLHHEYVSEYKDRYYRLINNKTKWYLGMNKDGSLLCGNVTSKRPDTINFTKGISTKDQPVMTDATPPNKADTKVTCCKKKRCRNKRKRNKCRKKWCRSHRRKFFKLSLKELRKYDKHCVKNKIRHCKSKREKKVDR
ncbi:Fibroblast growth factor 11 [Mactra antiquata]